MALQAITDWFCSPVRRYCSPTNLLDFSRLWQPFFRTFCFLQNALCIHQNHDQIGEAPPSPPVAPANKNISCTITDYIEVWTSDVRSKARTHPIQSESEWFFCSKNWYEIPDYVQHWTRALYETWCHLVNCERAEKMQINVTELVRVGNGEDQWDILVDFLRNHFNPGWKFLVCMVAGSVAAYAWRINQRHRKEPRQTPPEQKAVLEREFRRRLESALKRNRELQSELVASEKQLRRKLDSAVRRKNELEKELGLLRKEAERQREEIKREKSKNGNYQEENKRLQRFLEQEQAKNLNMQAETSTIYSDYVRRDEDYKEERQRNFKLQKQIVQVNMEKRNAEDRLELTKRLDHQQLQSVQNENVELLKRVRELENYIQQMQPVQVRMEAIREQNEAPNAALGEAKEEEEGDELSDLSAEDRKYVRKSLRAIEAIEARVLGYEKKIGEFFGTDKDRAYLHLKEMLIRSIIDLDNVESEGHDVIKSSRKTVIQCAQRCMDELQNKVK